MDDSGPVGHQQYLAFAGVSSLVFQGDVLVDWVAGGRAFGMDGSERRALVSYGCRFDSAIVAPDQKYAILFERLGAKAVLVDVRTGRVLREIDRSYYCANAFVFPLVMWTSAAGHTLLAHCPEDYNRLEIDDLDTGDRLSLCAERKPSDHFHSRLAVNPSGTRLLSAGWVWHPWDFVGWFDVDLALRDPRHLDQPTRTRGMRVGLAEEASAAWQTDDLLLIGSSDEPEDPAEVAEAGDAPRLVSSGLAMIDVRSAEVVWSVPLRHPPGAMMPVGTDEVVTFYEHPRLYRLSDGQLLHEWSELAVGRITSSIQHHLPAPQPLALDPRRARFALADGAGVTVVDLSARVRNGGVT
jgi:hypothetical protein